MKSRVVLLFALIMMSASLMAQEEIEHLQFMDVSIEGRISDFADRMKPNYVLKKRDPDNDSYIFQGTVWGNETLIKANYTRKSKTVYKVTVTPKVANEIVWIDSLTAKFGEPATASQGLVWERRNGIVVFTRPENYSPMLIFIDYQGQALFKKEK